MHSLVEAFCQSSSWEVPCLLLSTDTVRASRDLPRIFYPVASGPKRNSLKIKFLGRIFLGHQSMPNMTGRPGHWTMEMNGGSYAPYLACTPCVPLFAHCLIRMEAEGLLDYKGRAGIISIVRWNLRPVIFGVESGIRTSGYPRPPGMSRTRTLCRDWPGRPAIWVGTSQDQKNFMQENFGLIFRTLLLVGNKYIVARHKLVVKLSWPLM